MCHTIDICEKQYDETPFENKRPSLLCLVALKMMKISNAMAKRMMAYLYNCRVHEIFRGCQNHNKTVKDLKYLIDLKCFLRTF